MSSTGRVLLVTGAARGIGAATARLAAARGYAVAVNGRTPEGATALVAGLRAAGGTAEAFTADVTDETAVIAMFTAIDATLGPLDALVNNAGIATAHGPIHELDIADVRHLLEVNVLGTMLCCREAASRMSCRRGGVIVNVSSMAATIGGREGAVAYAASKAAVDALTVGLAKELAPQGIRVAAVRPGMTATDMTAALHTVPERAAAIASSIPMGRFAEADEVARAILWLVSDEASFVSGALLDVSGGGFVIR